MSTSRNPDGRPTTYNTDIATEICALISEGKSLNSICKSDQMPSLRTVFYWLRNYPEFKDQYVLAKDESADALIEEILEIADGTDELITNGAEKKSNAIAQAQKLKVDARKWIASKLKPKKYGEKVDVTSEGKAIKGNTIVFTDFSDETDS